ncbi:hypothetical protein Golax_005247, partial [Gossypium laxum]|nr:hypothetical protein [Gossypium laxum]
MDYAGKKGGHRKPRAHMEEFREVSEELALTNMIRQAKSDHDAVILDTIRRKPRDNIMEKFEMVSEKLGPWQYNRYRKMRNNISLLTEQIDKMIGSPYEMSNANSQKRLILNWVTFMPKRKGTERKVQELDGSKKGIETLDIFTFGLQLDMSKAYDWVEWNFLENVMRNLGFDDAWVFSSKYFPNGDLFHPKKVDKPSYTWSSIATTARALEKSFWWQGLNGDSMNSDGLYVHERKVHKLWTIDRMGWNKKSFENYGNCIWDCTKDCQVEESMRLLDKKVIIDFITILWNSWNNRSNFIFRGKEEEARKWEKPLRGTVKLNFDAIVSNKKKLVIGLLFVTTKASSLVVALVSKKRKWWAKLYAFEESLKLAAMMNITKTIFETDCATLTNKIKKRKDDITLMGYRINECFQNMDRLYNVDEKWANRTCNKVADCLSKYVISNESHSFFGVDYPTFIH